VATDRRTEPTKERILVAAEQLFAAHGVDGVSLREITRASGTRNTVGLQYHFKDRNGLLQAILLRHLTDVDARRHALLDQAEATGPGDIRALASALVLPWAAKLSDPSGRAFLQIYAELLNRPHGEETLTIGPLPSSIQRWRTRVAALMHPEAVRLHRRFIAIRLAVGELSRRATTGPHLDDRLFVGHLTDLVTSVLAAPVSEETVALADERDANRGWQVVAVTERSTA
jgi:AcrR family transcriptional regulator